MRQILCCLVLALSSFSAAGCRSSVFEEPTRNLHLGEFSFEEGLHGERVQAFGEAFEVPESWDRPGEATVRLHYVRFPSTAENPGPPIVYLAGGPGGSGTWTAMDDRFPLFMAMREVGDVIAIDQRGVWGSEPYTVCPGTYELPLDRALTEEAVLESRGAHARACADHFASEGIDVTSYTTRAAARDLVALADHLDTPKISLWAISHGTHVALELLRNDPGRVYRAVLAGVEGPDHTLKLPRHWDEQLEKIDRISKQLGIGDETFLESFDRLAEQLREPVTVGPVGPDGVEVTVGLLDAQLATIDLLSERDDIRDLLAAVDTVAGGDLTPLGEWAVGYRRPRRALAMAYTMDCSSGASADRLALIEEQAETSRLGRAMNFPYPDICADWPHDDLGDAFRSPVSSDVPTLFVSGSLDARTPVSNALEVLRGFENGHHLVIEGGGHDDDLFLSSPQISEVIRRFLAGADPGVSSIDLGPIDQ